jgi:oleate hydratase
MKDKNSEKKAGRVTSDTNLYIVGAGIAGLSAATFAVRDAHIPGKNIHIFEVLDSTGGSLYGTPDASDKFYFTRGDWKMGAKTHNSLWDAFSEIPSPDDPKKSVTEEIFEYNKIHKKDAKSRLIHAHQKRDNVESMGMSWSDRIRLLVLIYIPEKKIENCRIDSWFAPSLFKTNFWKMFNSMFAIEHWNDLVEMKRYVCRFFHDLHNIVSGRGETVTPYNNYDSMTVPMTQWLKEKGVKFEMECKVTDLDFKPTEDELTVEKLYYTSKGEDKKIDIRDCDFVFVTNGSMIADSRRGSMTEAPVLETGKLDGSWTLWENIAKKRSGLGNPSNFCERIQDSAWVIMVVNSKDPLFFNLYEKFTGNKPGQTNMVTFTDSNWHASVLVPNHPHFRTQPKDVYLWGACGLTPYERGNFVNKKMIECNGEELLTEYCYHFGFIKEMPQIIKNSICVPLTGPYYMAHLMPRKRSDRPPVVPKGSTNLALMGQFVECEECILLIETSARSAQIAVYSLLNVDKKVRPVYTEIYNPISWLKNLPTVFS